MRIGANYNKNNSSFKGIWNNKAVLRGLETVSEHSASFIAGTSFIMASGVRPLSIAITPNVRKENKEYAITNSIASGFVKFMMVEAVALPIENAIKKTEKNPEKYLKKETIAKFKNNAESLEKSRNFKFATQILKLSSGLITAIPKSILTVALIPLLMGKIFTDTKNSQQSNNIPTPKFPPVFAQSFKGGLSDITAKGISKILDNKTFQKFASKYSEKDTNIARDMTVATDLLLTASFAQRTLNNKNIKEERKKPLIMNSVYSTAATILGGCTIDNIIKKSTKNLINKFSEENKNNPKLQKYIEGINIVRPTLIFAGIYYGILPIITTYLADKTDNS